MTGMRDRATAASRAVSSVRALMSHGLTMDEAARRLNCLRPELVSRVLDMIGMWPSSEPELAALQRCQP